MNSSRRADAKCPPPVAVDWKDEYGVPRTPRSDSELAEFAGAARAEGEAERAVDLGVWQDVLGLPRSGPGEKNQGKSAQNERCARAADAAAGLTLSKECIARLAELRREFARAGDDTTVGERLLEDLVAMDAGVALALIDAEAAAVGLLQKTVPTDPAPAFKVAEVAREIGALSAGVRQRMQAGLAAAASLRAQRLSHPPKPDGK